MRNNTHKPLVAPHWPYLVACVIASTLMAWTAILGYAEALAVNPRLSIAHWEETGSIDNPQAASAAGERLQNALALNSRNAEFYLDLARLATLQANAAQRIGLDAQPYQAQAIANLKLALSKRPSWGLAWAKLAQAYADDATHTQDIIHALERAIYFEPYEGLTQQHIIPIAIAHWGVVPDAAKGRIKNIIQHALQYQPNLYRSVISSAVNNNWTDELAPLLTRKSHQDALSKAISEKQAGLGP